MSTQEVPTIQVVIKSLTDWLGPDLMGVMCGMKGSAPLKKWMVRPPNIEEEAKLRTGYEVFRIVRKVDSLEVAQAWMVGMNPHLRDHDENSDPAWDDGTPVVEIGLGDGRDVLTAARVYPKDPSLT